jgi:Na+/proline symporter
MENLLFIVLIVYAVALLGLAIFVSSKTESEEDFLVGGRRFNLWLTTFCLFATWFGAGTLISATDEVASEGLIVTALEPYGAGACLLLAGLFFAKPLWNMQLMTFSDFFRIKFGHRLEHFSVFCNIPIYVGWIAVQIVSLAKILAVFFPLPEWSFILIIAAFTCILTVSGGLWSVSFTDSFQLFVIIIGLFYLLFKVLGGDPAQLFPMLEAVSQDRKILIPTDKLTHTLDWFGVFCISALGNMTGQDLGQRMFSAKSAKTAQWGCYLAGLGYLVVGSIPVFLGLTASQTMGAFNGSVIPNLIKNFLDPISAVILTVTIISSVISTITSALLAPSSVLSHNFLKQIFTGQSVLKLCQYSVVIVTLVSVLVAFMGEDVYGLLESSYTIGFVAFFPAVTIGLYSKKLNEKAILLTICLATIVWLPELFGYEQIPFSLLAVAMSYPIYFVIYKSLGKTH